MPQQNEAQSNPLVLILIVGGILLWWANSRDNTPSPPKPDDDQNQVEPKPAAEPSEADHWNALALCVDRSAFGVQQQNTDHLLSIIDLLKETGGIKDDSRVANWRSKRVEITDANRGEVSKILRGR